MEAMASEIPVVASKIPCIPDLIDDGKTGFFVFSEKITKDPERNGPIAGKINQSGSQLRAGMAGYSR